MWGEMEDENQCNMPILALITQFQPVIPKERTPESC